LLALVRNLGGGPAEDFTVAFGGLAGPLATVTDLHLGPRRDTTVTVTFATAFGVDSLHAVVDPDSLLGDPDREDNRAETVLRVLPDLAAPGDSILYSEADTTLSGLVTNLSATTSSAFTVRFFRGNPQADGVALDSVRVESLDGGASLRIGIRWRAPFGASVVYVAADADHEIPELDEFNNLRYQHVILSGAPQLTVVAGSVAWHVAKGPEFSLSARIANLGTAPAFAIPVQFHRGDPDTGSTFIGGMIVPDLAARDTVTVTVPWMEPDPVINQIFVIVDAANSIAESVESDNRAVGLFGNVLDIANGPRIPVALALHPARPNPFTHITSIRFDLPVGGPVRLEIFDVMGRRVRTLLRQEMPAGYHAVQWEGATDGGRALDAGVYFLRLETMGRSLKNKIAKLE
jgi:subtilase family serine protease